MVKRFKKIEITMSHNETLKKQNQTFQDKNHQKLGSKNFVEIENLLGWDRFKTLTKVVKITKKDVCEGRSYDLFLDSF